MATKYNTNSPPVEKLQEMVVGPRLKQVDQIHKAKKKRTCDGEERDALIYTVCGCAVLRATRLRSHGLKDRSATMWSWQHISKRGLSERTKTVKSNKFQRCSPIIVSFVSLSGILEPKKFRTHIQEEVVRNKKHTECFWDTKANRKYQACRSCGWGARC